MDHGPWPPLASNPADSPAPSSSDSHPPSHPPSLLCSTNSGSVTPCSDSDHAGTTTAQQQQEGAGLDRPPRQLAAEPPPPAVACDDASYFDGEWVSSTVQSAVTHFFGSDGGDGGDGGNDDDDNDDDGSRTAVAGDSDSRAGDQENDVADGTLSPAPVAASVLISAAEVAGMIDNSSSNHNSSSSNASNGHAHPAIDASASDAPLSLLGRARSLSPPSSLVPPVDPGGCAVGIYSCPAAGGDGESPSRAAAPPAADYRPHFSPADFRPQTWADVLGDASTIRYCGAGAAVLTAAIVIHPLALIGAVSTAVVSATAMWAVGFFHDLDKGYQIWSEDFGMLFWAEDDEDANGDGGGSVADGTSVAGGGAGRAATATSEGHQIIQKDGEHLRSVFLLEQQRQRMEEKVRVVRLDSTGRLHEVKNGSVEGDREGERGKAADLTTSARTSKGTGTMPPQQPPLSKKGYRLRRIKSAPVKDSRSSDRGGPLPVPSKTRGTPRSTPPSAPRDGPSAAATALVDAHFPALEICVARRVELPGLNTAEFFSVFFADDAPYSMRDFQRKRGDVDIVYSRWEPCCKDEDKAGCLYSFKRGDGCASEFSLETEYLFVARNAKT